MIKKLLLTLAPVLVLASFAVMPAFAQAQTRAYGICEKGTPHTAECPAGEKNFKAFTNKVAVKVITKKTKEGPPFVLTDTVTGGVIECKSLNDKGTVENVGGIGKSKEELTFDECSVLVGTTRCKVITAGNSPNVVGTVTDIVEPGGTTVTITVTGGFALIFDGLPASPPCPAAGTPIGTVTGSATGAQAAGSNDLVFKAAPGLFLGKDASTITGNDESFFENAKKELVPVVIN